MFDASTKSVWYGRLKTASSDTPVIYDPGLPDPPTGQIYLYNAERNAILKYAAHVVQPMLKSLEKSERKEVEKELGRKWRSTRKSFLREHGSCLSQRANGSSVSIRNTSPQLDIDDNDDEDWSDDLDTD